jgi:hypothetical protein
MESFKIKKITRVAATAICLLCCLPQIGICSLVPIEQIALDLIPSKNANYLLALYIDPNPLRFLEQSLEDLTETISLSEDPLITTRQFFYAFLDQLNAQNGTSLTIEEGCRLLRQNINLVPTEYREIFLIATDSIESDVDNESLHMMAKICWPWEWNWFGLNKKDKKYQKSLAALTSNIPPKVLIFGLIVAGVTLVAIFNPAAIAVATKALTQAAPVFF